MKKEDTQFSNEFSSNFGSMVIVKSLPVTMQDSVQEAAVLSVSPDVGVHLTSKILGISSSLWMQQSGMVKNRPVKESLSLEKASRQRFECQVKTL